MPHSPPFLMQATSSPTRSETPHSRYTGPCPAPTWPKSTPSCNPSKTTSRTAASPPKPYTEGLTKPLPPFLRLTSGPRPLGVRSFSLFINCRIFPRRHGRRSGPERPSSPRSSSATSTSSRPFRPSTAIPSTSPARPTPTTPCSLCGAMAWHLHLLARPASGIGMAPPISEDMAARYEYAANVLQPMLDAAIPGGGVYMNERGGPSL